MSELGPEARRLIAATLHVDDPSPVDRQLMRARLDASWATAASGQPLPLPRPRGLRDALTLKHILGALMVFTALTTLTVIGSSLSGSGPQPTAAMRSVPVASVRSELTAEPARPELAPANLAERPEPGRAGSGARPASNRRLPAAARRARDSSAQASVQPPSAAMTAESSEASVTPSAGGSSNRPVPAGESLEAELRLLGAAQDALHANQPQRVLQLARQHELQFPLGALAQERMSVQALALCALQRTAPARELLDELTRRTPGAPVLARIRADCGFESEESARQRLLRTGLLGWPVSR